MPFVLYDHAHLFCLTRYRYLDPNEFYLFYSFLDWVMY
ncbi:hypothetical protein CCP4SC76_6580023 [Gammaproteobacteria bacterium]